MAPLHCSSVILSVSVAACILAGAPAASAVVANGQSVNSLVGADRWYANGFTGLNARLANVEGGHIWSGHSALNVANVYSGSGTLNQVTDHATGVASVMAGNGPGLSWQGIAFDATLASGAIATSYNSSGQFSLTTASLRSGLVPHLGNQGRRADIINMSWGDSSLSENTYLTSLVDGAIAQSGSLIVVSSGNTGLGANRVGSPARGYNTLSVGALQSASTGFDRLAYFSSGGAVNFVNPANNSTVSGVRPAVDLVAPGTNLTVAATGSSLASNNNAAGTSYAAPITAGGAGLLVDAARSTLPGTAAATDPRTLKAVLMNSARKIGGWDNGQRSVNNVITTDQALDFRSGAGALDLDAAYDQFITGHTDLAGTSGGLLTSSIGWDFASVSQGSNTDYNFDKPLEEGSNLNITLSWQADARYNAINNFNDTSASMLSLDDLDLELWRLNEDRSIDSLVARSQNRFDSIEHLSLEIQETAYYLLRVTWVGETFDLINDVNTEQFSIAFAGVFSDRVLPGPASISAFAVFLLVCPRRRPLARLS